MNGEMCSGIAIRPGTDIDTVLCPVCEKQEVECSKDMRKDPTHKWSNDRGWVTYAMPCGDCLQWCREQRSKEMRARNQELYSSNLPKLMVAKGVFPHHKDARLSDFPETIKKATTNLKCGLLIYGPTGTGKTHLGAALMREDLFRRQEAEMVDCCFLLMRIRNSFREGGVETELDIVSRYSDIQNLYIDDFGSDKTTDFTIATLRTILNNRWGRGLRTVIMTNLTPEELTGVYGERVASRVFGMCSLLNLQGSDRRLKFK